MTELTSEGMKMKKERLNDEGEPVSANGSPTPKLYELHIYNNEIERARERELQLEEQENEDACSRQRRKKEKSKKGEQHTCL